MKRILRRIAIVLIFTLLTPELLTFVPSLDSLTAAEVSAATIKAELGKTEATIGIYSSPEYVYLKLKNDDAKYQYTSANPKIATVSGYGEIEGVAKGKTTITVTETYNDAVNEVGKISINVVGPKLEIKTIDVGLNSQTYTPINYMNYKAVYTYKSSDTKIATVDEYGCITGVKYGKATISVTEKYKGKTVKVGSFTANIVSGKLAAKEMEVPVSSYGYSQIYINCRNSKATYKFKSADTKIATVDKEGYVTGIKKGTATISVTETYNKKTVKIGSVKVKVVGASINQSSEAIDIGINSTNYLTSIISIKNMNYEATYTCTSADNSIVWAGTEENSWGSSDFHIKGISLGTTIITVYEEYKDTKQKVGTVNITVKEIPVTDLILFDELLVYVDGVPTITYYLDYSSGDYLNYYYYTMPFDTSTPVTYANSDETVVTIDEKGYITPQSEGTAVITVSCGEFSFDIKIIVKSSDPTDTDPEDGEFSEDSKDPWDDGFN